MLMGNLTRDPQIRQVASGVAVTDMGLATSEVYKNRDGEQVESTCFVDIVAWGRQAETCAEYLSKGAPVFVEGRLQFDQWEAKDGGRRSKLRVRANRVQFLGRPRSDGATTQATVEEEADEPMPF
jgi:single-strand DNA-binding protein